MPSLGFPEIIFLVVIIVVLFGAKRLPDAARSLGRSLRIFKSEIKELGQDDNPTAQQSIQTPTASPTTQPGTQIPSSQPVKRPDNGSDSAIID